MNRRHFIKVTAGTLAAVSFGETIFAAANPVIGLPSSVKINRSDGWHTLVSKNKRVWTANSTIVSLVNTKGGLAVEVLSPTSKLIEVVLEWPFSVKTTSLVLPDHWERTYGDIAWQKPVNAQRIPWYFLLSDEQVTKAFGVKTGAAAICNWNIGPGSIALHLDTRNGGNGVKLGTRKLNAAEIVITQSTNGESAFATGRRFCGIMCQKPRLSKLPVYGINDWYFAYGKNSDELILQHTALLAPLVTDASNLPFSVVDAGWAAYSPLLPDDCCWQDDFSKPNEHFKDMGKLASNIKGLGMRPALWTRPLCGRHNDNANRILPAIKGRNDAKKPVLDPTIDENLERIIHNFKTYDSWGYEMVKHDFSTYDMLGKWGFEMSENITQDGWHFNDETKTTAEVVLKLYKTIREAAGNMYLIGCNTIGHLAAGLFELNRIGDDTSGQEWERTRKMGVNTLAFRSIQHNKFFAADADCVGLTTSIAWSRNKQWMDLLAKSGTPLFISAQPEAMGAEQKTFIKECFALAAKPLPVAEPLDWMTNITPAKWKLNNEEVSYDWS